LLETASSAGHGLAHGLARRVGLQFTEYAGVLGCESTTAVGSNQGCLSYAWSPDVTGLSARFSTWWGNLGRLGHSQEKAGFVLLAWVLFRKERSSSWSLCSGGGLVSRMFHRHHVPAASNRMPPTAMLRQSAAPAGRPHATCATGHARPVSGRSVRLASLQFLAQSCLGNGRSLEAVAQRSAVVPGSAVRSLAAASSVAR
jgi:hypothetical protein